MTGAQQDALRVLASAPEGEWVRAGKRRSYGVGDAIRPFGEMNHRHVNMIAARALARAGYADAKDVSLERAAEGLPRLASEVFGCTLYYRATERGRRLAEAHRQNRGENLTG